MEEGLARFVDSMGQQSGERWVLHSLEAGGDGDCFFHAVAAGLENMFLDPEARDHISQHFQQADFQHGKLHIVAKLRNMVAEHIACFPPETLLEMALSFRRQQRLRVNWHDDWDPLGVLRASGFASLQDADAIQAIGPNEDGRATDIVVSYTARTDPEQESTLELMPVQEGASKLEILRTRMKDIFSTCGNTHWATQTDIAAVAERLNIGFIVLASREQGEDRWIQGLNLERGNFPIWMLIYWQDPAHYRLARLICNGQPNVFFAQGGVPQALRAHYDLCNGSSPMGRAHYGGIS